MKIIFSQRPGNLVSWLIRKYIGKNYSHTAIMTSLYGVDIILESSLDGVNIVTLNKFNKKNKIVKEIDISRVVSNELVMGYAFKNIDMGFSFLAFVGIILKNKTIGEDEERFQICSEFVARAIGLSGELDHITPKDIEKEIAKIQKK